MSFNAFFLRGVVVHGKGRGGSQLGFPTANVCIDKAITEQLKPYENLVLFGWGTVVGVAGKEESGFGPFPVAASVGFNMHFSETELTVEAHFLHHFGWDFYGATVKLIFVGVVRQMASFPTLDKLIDTIKGDVEFTRVELQKEELQNLSQHELLIPQLLETDKSPHFEVLKGIGEVEEAVVVTQ